MTQRNPMNPRSQNKTYKGVSRKSASSAKPVRQAGSSVRTVSREVREKQQKKAQKAEAKEEQRKERERAAVLGAAVLKTPEYKKWRKIWVITLVIAVVAIAASWGCSALVNNGTLPAELFGTTAPVTIALIVIGYGGLVGALVIDFRKIRKMRKAYETRAYNLSKREKRELDQRIAESHQPAEPKDKGDKASRLPWNKKKSEDESGETAAQKD